MKKRLTFATALASLFLMGATTVSAAVPASSGAAAGAGGSDSPRKALATTLPYYNDFNEESKFEGWTVANPNPFFTWRWYDSGGMDYSGCLYMSQMPVEGTDHASDNWVFSPAFDLQKGFTYRLKFYITHWFPTDLDVRLLTKPEIDENGTLLFHKEGKDEWGDKEMEFEVPANGKYYIAFHDKSPYTTNGTALRYQVYIDNLLLEALSNNAIPETVGELKQVPGKNGEVSMGLTWFNPSLDKKGETIDGLSNIQIFRDGTLVETLRENLKPGEKMSWTDPAPTAGVHTYKVIAANSTGESDPAIVNTFVGIDDCGTPQNLIVAYDADMNTIALEWEAPEFGRRGGWYDNAGLSYRVVRKPGGKIIANNFTKTFLEDEDLDEYGNYIYEVTARTNAGLGGTAISNGTLVGTAASLPLVEGFENPDTYPTIKIVDNNADGHTFEYTGSGYESNHCISWNYLQTEVDFDESIYFAPVKLEKGKKYRASFWICCNMYGSFSCDLTYGKSRTKAAQTGKIVSYSGMSTGGQYAPSVTEFSVNETGTYYFALYVHDCSKHRLYFDEFRFEEILDKNVEATAVNNLNNYPTAGDKITTGVKYTNRGTSKTSSFKVQLIDDDENVLGEQTVSRALNADAEGTANITWTVPEFAGRFGIRGRVVMEGDKCEADNTSAPIYLDVQQKGNRAFTVGTSDQLSDKLPFNYYSYNFSETIYPKEEFNGYVGNITGLKFKVQFGQDSDYDKVPFAVYVGQTNENDLFKGWTSSYSLTKVFDGTLDLMRGMTEVEIPFTTPYAYTGSNLVVRVVGAHGVTHMLSGGYGMQCYVTDGELGVSRIWDNRDVRPDLTNLDQNVGAFYAYRPNAVFMLDHTTSVKLYGKITDKDGNAVEGAKVSGGSSYPNIFAMTDAEGKYEIEYFPVGWGTAQLQIDKLGYQRAYAYGSNLKGGMTVEVNYNTLTAVPKVKVIGKVCSGIDNTTPIQGATVKLQGNGADYTLTTDAEGQVVIEDLYGQTQYYASISADGYKFYENAYTQFYPNADGENIWINNLTAITAAPASLTAFDRGDKAEISWEAPIEDVTISKSSNEVAGQIGGAAGMLIVAQRYTAEELQKLDVKDLFLKNIGFVPMCTSKYTITVWQGPEGNEAPVYLEDVTVPYYNLQKWNTFNLTKPFKIDPSKSLLVGLKIEGVTGGYPVGFDAGPVREGGDVLFDVMMNRWTTAHDELPGQMDYNWSIQATFGPDANANPVSWLNTETKAPAQKVLSRNNATLEELEALNGSMAAEKDAKVAPLADSKIEMLETPIYAPIERAALHHEYLGYNLYRLEAGQEKSWIGSWTKLNDEPITDTKYTDETWGGIDNKVYRYAVTTYYGAPTQWSTVYSASTFSDGIDKGHYSTVTVNVTPDNGNADDTKVYLTGDGKTTVKSVKAGEKSVTFENVRFTDYKVMAMKPYFNLATSDLKVDQAATSHEVKLEFAAPAPTALNAVDYIKEARLNWNSPTSEIGCTFAQCSDAPGMNLPYKLGQELIVGSRLTEEMLKNYSYTDFYIDEISFYANAAGTYSPVVWRRNLEPQRPLWGQQQYEEEHEIYRQDYKVSPEEVGTWVTVKLDEPVKLEPQNTYYYGFASTSTNEFVALALDDSNGAYPEGMWYYDFDQKNAKYDWLRPSMGGSWMTKAHITDTPDKSKVTVEPVKYDIYRLAEADAENESAWKKVNTAAVDTESYVDATWKDQADANYRYAVKANFSGDATSAAALSKVLQKGKVSLLNVDIKTNNGLSAAGAKLNLYYANNKYLAEADAEGKIEIPEVVKGKNYHLELSLAGYEPIEGRLNVDKAEMTASYELLEVKEAPVYVQAEVAADNSKVDLSWREPGAYAPAEGWVFWDNNKPYAGFGTSTGFCAVAQAYTPEDLESFRMKEYDITKIAFVPTTSETNPVAETSYWIAKIWKLDVATSEVTEVATGDGKGIVCGQWNEIEFDEPYHVNGDETLLIGYEFHGSGNALGIDQGPCKMGRGDWANFGQGWSTLSSMVDGFDYNNLIHAFVERLDKPGRKNAHMVSRGATQPVVKDLKADVTISKVKAGTIEEPEHARLQAGVKYNQKGYLVYRLNGKDRNNESEWTLLTPEPITATELTDINWKNVGKGDYRWAVKAVYATGNSEAAMTEYALNEDGSVNGIEGVSEDGIRVVALSEGRVLVEVPEDASVIVNDAKGMTVLSAELTAGETVLDVNSEGVCLVTLDINGKVSSYKVMIRK